MDRLSVCGVLSLLTFLVGGAALGFVVWFLAGIPAEPGPDGGFLTGFAIVGALLVGAVGIAVIGFGLVISPARAEGGGVLTVRRRQRLVSGAGLATVVASLLVPYVALRVGDLSDAVVAWLWLVGAGALLIGAAFVWTVGEEVLVRAGVVD